MSISYEASCVGSTLTENDECEPTWPKDIVATYCTICDQTKHIYKCTICAFECCFDCFIRIRDDKHDNIPCHHDLAIIDGNELEIHDPLLNIHLTVTMVMKTNIANGTLNGAFIKSAFPAIDLQLNDLIQYNVSLDASDTKIRYNIDISQKTVSDSPDFIKPWILMVLHKPITIMLVYDIHTKELTICKREHQNNILTVYNCATCPFDSSYLYEAIDHCKIKHEIVFHSTPTHQGEWRDGKSIFYCSKIGQKDGLLCEHRFNILKTPHWSCCGATEQREPCIRSLDSH